MRARLHTSNRRVAETGCESAFRVASDGRGMNFEASTCGRGEVHSVKSEPHLEHAEGLKPIKIQCEGVYGLQLDLPNALSEDWIKCIKQLGLNQARAIDVWPVGIPPAAWDGDGRVEWLKSDALCLAIRSDHPIGQLQITLDRDEWSRIQFPTIAAGETTFVELPELPVGSHSVTFRAHMIDGRTTDDVGHLQVHREPKNGCQVTSQGAFIVSGSVHQACQCGGRHSPEIHGPAGRHITTR